MHTERVPAATLAAATVLLQQHCPDLSPTVLAAALRQYGRPAPVGQRRLLTAAEAGAALGCCAATVKRLVRGGKLPGVLVGSTWRVPVSAIDALAAGVAPVEG